MAGLTSNRKEFFALGDQKKFEIKLEYGRGKKAKLQPFQGFKDLDQTMRTTSSDSLRAKLLTFQYGTLCESCWAAAYRPIPDPFFSLDARFRNSFHGHLRKHGNLSVIKLKREKCMQVEDALHGLEQRLGFINKVTMLSWAEPSH